MKKELTLIAAISLALGPLAAPRSADALFLRKALESAKNAVKSAAAKAGKLVKDTVRKIGDGAKKAASAVGSWAKKTASNIKKGFERAGAWMKKAGHWVLNKIHFRRLIPIAKDGSRVLPCGETENHNQCTSSDRCGWCASTRKCLALQSTTCRRGWYQKDPDRTLDSAKPHAPTRPRMRAIGPPGKRKQEYSPAGSLDIKRIVGAAYERIRAVLARMIPGAVRDVLVDAFILRKWRNYRPERRQQLAQLGLPPPPPNLDKLVSGLTRGAPERKGVRYYIAHARHARADVHTFVGVIPMARITLPDRAVDFTVKTATGDVVGSDHLIRNRHNMVFKGYPAERVELITPTRQAGARFAAVALYLGYRRKTDRRPSYYALEAGLAQGGARVMYFSPSMKDGYWVSGYVPTNLASAKNIYHGTLTMKGDELASLKVELWNSDPRRNRGAKNPFDLTIRFERVSSRDSRLSRNAADMYREAVIRNAAISEATKTKMAGMNSVLQKIFAREGKHDLRWVIRPR